MAIDSKSTTDMNEAEKVVRAFFDSWDKDGFVVAFEKHLHDDVLYQNLGFDDVKGKKAALGVIDYYLSISNMPYGWVEYIAIASSGNMVLTERVDHLFNADKTKKHATKIMGAFEVKDGKIIRYSDYFDPRQFLQNMDINHG
jgi:limonene-1,2-epoxide hydrolase